MNTDSPGSRGYADTGLATIIGLPTNIVEVLVDGAFRFIPLRRIVELVGFICCGLFVITVEPLNTFFGVVVSSTLTLKVLEESLLFILVIISVFVFILVNCDSKVVHNRTGIVVDAS